MKTINKFITKIRRQRHSETIYNPYRHLKLSHNLKVYLEYMQSEIKPKVLLIGEALGYKGGKLTGIPFSSGDIITHSSHPLFIYLREHICVETMEAENTATIIWQYLHNHSITPLCWNAFPYHPHPLHNKNQNRAPIASELKQGREFLTDIIELYQPKTIAAIGNKAYDSCSKAFLEQDIVKIRHPSYGGKKDFIQGMDRLLIL